MPTSWLIIVQICQKLLLISVFVSYIKPVMWRGCYGSTRWVQLASRGWCSSHSHHHGVTARDEQREERIKDDRAE